MVGIRWLHLARRCLPPSRQTVEVGDQIGHVHSIEARPGQFLGLHLVEHLGTMMPQRRDQNRSAESAPGEFRSAAGRIVMTRRAVLGLIYAPAGLYAAGVAKELVCPQTAG